MADDERFQAELDAAREQLDEAQAVAHVGSWRWTVGSNIVEWSPELYRILGRDPRSFTPGVESFEQCLHEDDRHRIRSIRDAAIRNTEQASYTARIVRPDRTVRWIEVTATPTVATDALAGFVGTVLDITDRKTAETDLTHSASHDDLTDLPNRAMFLDRLQVALARLTGNQGGVAVLVCAVDHLTVINDSLGHDAGDEVLVRVAKRLSGAVAAGDTVGCIGGAEFVLCCQDVSDIAAAEFIATRIARTLARPLIIDGSEVFVTASIGIQVADSSSDAADVLRDAVAAMYQAKTTGRASHAVFDDSLRSQVQQDLETATGLHHALERRELRVYYQPTMSIRTGSIIGVEALLRWRRPGWGMWEPEDFVGVAEETGLILPIGLWALEHACRQLQDWNERGSGRLTMAVNVSPRQLGSPELVDRVAEILARTGVRPSDVCLEITEHALMQDSAIAAEILGSLKTLGLRLAMDDFGTGYASLANLHRFPIDVVKIDQSFVAQLGVDSEATEIVSAVIRLAEALDLEIVAEGVETHGQLALLELLGCPSAQGYYWSRALPADEIGASLTLTAGPPVDVRRLQVPGRDVDNYGVIP